MTAQVDPFHAIAVSTLAHRLKAQGRRVIHMEFGQPSTGAPAAAIAEAHRRLDAEPGGYWENPALKARIARLYAERHGISISPEQVILTCGASPGLVLALSMAFAPGDTVAIARPGYVAYRNNLRALHMVPLELPCGEAERFQLTAAAIAALDPAPKGVIVASPANPTGTIIPRDEMAAIARICAARGIAIISDEIYHGIAYGMDTPSMLEFAPGALVVNSFSKFYSMAGWRLGWLIVPESGIAAARARMGNLFLTPSTRALSPWTDTRTLPRTSPPMPATAPSCWKPCRRWAWAASPRRTARSMSMPMSRTLPMTAWTCASACWKTPASQPRPAWISIRWTASASCASALPSRPPKCGRPSP
jgi:aspartate/methionine/tyrosine aminotransferase